MDLPPREPVLVWSLLRRHFVRIVIASVLAVVVYGLLIVWMPYQREQRIAKKIESHGGAVDFAYFGPDWMPQSVKDRFPYFDRIREVWFSDRVASAKLPSELGSLTCLEWLDLEGTQVTDAGLEYLKDLASLKTLILINTQVTDAGLEHLKGLTDLKEIFLSDTQVTAEGRLMLRKALPGCAIFPEDD